MELARLIASLTDPSAYPRSGSVGSVQVHQTHISVVFLAGDRAYKIKKPVDLGFVNYGTLELRRAYCEREVQLNRRLAPTVYLGVVPVTVADGRVQIEGEEQGEVIEWAVKMERLPEQATLRERLRRGEVGPLLLEALAVRIARFHACAASGPEVAACGRYEVVERNALENFEQAARHVGTTVSRAGFDRLRQLTMTALARLKPMIDERAARGVPRDGHGDLRLDHVYLFPEREPPADLVIVDCIEFNERLRWADPVADIAFPFMDLAERGHRELAQAFADAYFKASGDDEGRRLLPFYTAYRAAVRGKVEGMEQEEQEVPEDERAAALERSQAHWLLALSELESPGRRPCLVLVGGLPGVGKSTLTRGLVEHASFSALRTDEVRKELTRTLGHSGASSFESGIYSPEWTERTYAECLRRAEKMLFEGRRVLVDASFRAEADRQRFLHAATRWSIPAILFLCHADPPVVRARLRERTGDVSDADWSIYLESAARWEPPGPSTRSLLKDLDTGKTPEEALSVALGFLGERSLVGE